MKKHYLWRNLRMSPVPSCLDTPLQKIGPIQKGPTMTTAEDALWGLRQDGLNLERYVEEFLELSNRVSWHDVSLGACFHLRLNDKTIRGELHSGSYPLIELINLVLFLNGSDWEVEAIPESCHPAPAGTRSASPAHPMPRTSAYFSNGSPAYLTWKTLLRLRCSHPAHLRLRWPRPAYLRLRWPCPAHLRLR